MSSGQRFKHESIQESAAVIKYLKALCDGFENQALTFSSEDRCLVLRPKGMINLEVDAKSKDGEMKLTVKLRWRDKEKDQDLRTNGLTIQAAENA